MIKFDLNLEYLKTFVLVASYGNMNRAAEECHLTQPAVTRQMALLASGVGVRIFIKFGRGIRLTPAGSQLLVEAQELFQRIDAGIGRVREADGQSGLRISLGASHYVALNGLADPVRMFQNEHPEVRINFSCGSSEEMICKVQNGAIDLAVVTLPGKSEGLVRIRLWTDTFIAAIPESHFLSKQQDITLEDIANETVILPPSSSTTRALIDSSFRKKRIRPSRFLEISTLETIAASVDMALGLAILPARIFLRKNHGFRNVEIRPIRDFSESRELGILSRRGRPLGTHERALIESLAKGFDMGKDG